MKKKPVSLWFLLPVIMLFMVVACDKDDDEKEQNSDYSEELTKIVSAKFLDNAKALGFSIHKGNNPPDVTGEWKIDPIVAKDGVARVSNAVLSVLSQDGTSIQLMNKYPAYGDPVLKQFIMGSGNNFTIVHHYRIWGQGAVYNAPYVLLLSGTREGAAIKNLKMANISLPYDWPGGHDGLEHSDGGVIEIYSDGDGTSEKL